MSDIFLIKACRVCLKQDKAELFDWKTGRIDKKYNYAECFQEVTQIPWSQDLPQMLCYDCAYELRITHAFINRAHKVDRKLRSYIGNRAKTMPVDCTHEKTALLKIPKVELDEMAQSGPACCGQVETNDLFGNIAAEALFSPLNDLEQESFANTTLIEQSIDLGSDETEPAVIQAAPPNLIHEEENQDQPASPQYGAEQSVGYIIDPNLCDDTLECTNMETAVDSPSSMEFIKEDIANDEEEEMTDGLLVPLEVLEKKSKTAAASTKKRTLSRSYFCNECGAGFTNTSNMYRHQMQQHNFITRIPKQDRKKGGRKVTPQQCEHCKETFPNKSKLSYHMLRTHEEWLCHACPRVVKSKLALQKHVKTHEHRERKFGCEVCGIKCLTASILRGHMQVHEKDRRPKYACDECDKTFYVRSGLVLHKRHHSGDTVSCKECGRAFPRPVDLKVHMRSHSKERPYQCDICDQNFANVTNLKYHKLEHEGVEYKCDVCDRVYRNRTSFMKHKREHETPSLQCRVCLKLFLAKYKIMRHIKGVHKIRTSEEAEELVIRLKKEKKFKTRRKGFFTEK